MSSKMFLMDSKTEEKSKQNIKLEITRVKESNIFIQITYKYSSSRFQAEEGQYPTPPCKQLQTLINSLKPPLFSWEGCGRRREKNG